MGWTTTPRALENTYLRYILRHSPFPLGGFVTMGHGVVKTDRFFGIIRSWPTITTLFAVDKMDYCLSVAQKTEVCDNITITVWARFRCVSHWRPPIHIQDNTHEVQYKQHTAD